METHPKIPTVANWGDFKNDPDTNYAYGRFGGKSLSEVMPFFQDSVLGASEDIRSMPKIPFQFYILAFREFLTSPDLIGADQNKNFGASDGGSTFLNLVRDKLRDSPDLIIDVMPELMPVVEYVAAHQKQFRASSEIYGSFIELLEQIKQLYATVLV